MSIFVTALLVWYGLQFIEAWVWAAAGEYESGRPVGSLAVIIGCAYLGFSVFTQTDGPVTGKGWVLVAYYVINVGMGFYVLARGPKRDEWGLSSALTVTVLTAAVLWLWFTGVLA